VENVVGGTPIENMARERRQNVISAKDMGDAVLSGLDQGEFDDPTLPSAADWDAFEAARQRLRRNFLHAVPAERYRVNTDGAAEHAGSQLKDPAQKL
jgi:uncharacterized protein